MGARHRVGIGLLYRPARLHRLAEFIPWNRFRGPIHVQKYQLSWVVFTLFCFMLCPREYWTIYGGPCFLALVSVPRPPPPPSSTVSNLSLFLSLPVRVAHIRRNFKDSNPLMSSLLGGGEVREKVEGQQYTSIVPSSMGATVDKLGRKYQPWVKHNAAKSVNRSILKKSQHTRIGVFIVHLSMVLPIELTDRRGGSEKAWPL